MSGHACDLIKSRIYLVWAFCARKGISENNKDHFGAKFNAMLITPMLSKKYFDYKMKAFIFLSFDVILHEILKQSQIEIHVK